MAMGKGAMHTKPGHPGKGHNEDLAALHVQRAHYAKADATDRWVRGEINSAKHEAVHGRANTVIKSGGKLDGVGVEGARESVHPAREKTFHGKNVKQGNVTGKAAKRGTQH